MTNPIVLIITAISVALFAQSLFSLYLMLYSWEHPQRIEASNGPRSFLPPRLSFTVLLPARHEEKVIRQTIRRVISANYPANLLEVVVICHRDDTGTIAEAERAIRELGTRQVRVETFADAPINKPHGLNVGFARSGNDVVTIFDAEDDIDGNIFNVANTVMLSEETGIVQAGVQLMNFKDHWFGMHNCLEYFFYFKSRLHYHAQVGMIPLGGNTVFIRRELIARVGGWDQHCLTEDADIGLRLSLLGEPIRVVYDAQHVTREETPDSVGSFVRQRTRWNQGFIQVLMKGSWRSLPRFGQRALALYTLSYPLLQAALMLAWPATILALIWLKLSVPVVMLSFLPLYALLFQLLVSMVGAYLFCREYGFRFPLLLPAKMAVTFLPFQWVLGVSAVRAVYRQLRSQVNWEKTAHLGAHRLPEGALSLEFERLLDDARATLGVERGSVMALNPSSQTFSIVASRGLPSAVDRTAQIDVRGSVAGWVAQHGRSALLNGKALPRDLTSLLAQPKLRSAILVPIEHAGATVAVLSVSSTRLELDDDALRWLDSRVRGLGETQRASLVVSVA